MSDLTSQVEAAARDGKLLPDAARNIAALLAAGGPSGKLYHDSIEELVGGGHWEELNDRFFRTLAFGTGGLRGRTIGKIVTAAEQGEPQALGRPQFPCVGTNAMNDYNVSRATQGLVAYLKKWVGEHGPAGTRPKLVIAYDTRHFLARFRGADHQGRHRERLRRGPIRRPALDAGIILRRAADARAGGHRRHGQPQPAARLRLQGVFRPGRADRRTAGQRDHRGGQRGQERGVRRAPRGPRAARK